ncbi:MAG: hypothetical protein Q4G35_01595 [Propionibacteriaceae bacterium]|nr:hypothetical protein [Propionibacteriaceae bacterium]
MSEKNLDPTAGMSSEEIISDEELAALDLAIEDALENDEQMQEILRLMNERVCDYCESEITWVEPSNLRSRDPQSFNEVLDRDRIEADSIIMAWECTECENFALIGEDYEVQWLDIPLECTGCQSRQVEVIDPAQAVHINRERYLDAKKKVGAQRLLNGEAHHCLDCGLVAFLPGPAGVDF